MWIWLIFTIKNLFTYLTFFTPGWTAMPEALADALGRQWWKQQSAEGVGRRLRAKLEAIRRQQWRINRARPSLGKPQRAEWFGKADQEHQRRRPSRNQRPNRCCLQKHLHMRNYYSMIIIHLNDGMFFDKDLEKRFLPIYFLDVCQLHNFVK